MPRMIDVMCAYADGYRNGYKDAEYGKQYSDCTHYSGPDYEAGYDAGYEDGIYREVPEYC